MPTTAHFIDVGCGNMTLLQLDDGTIMLYDCNVTSENEERVLAYLRRVIPPRGKGLLSFRFIDIFVNSHRDSDHMRGLPSVHKRFRVRKIWDCGVAGGTPMSTDYLAYMQLRRDVGHDLVQPSTYFQFGRSRVRIFSGKCGSMPDDPNAQSIVIKVEHLDRDGKTVLRSLLLAGDSSALTWEKAILPNYGSADLESTILLASHHGSMTFFNGSEFDQTPFTNHIRRMAPRMTIISVGPNKHGLPDRQALVLYKRHSSGSDQGRRILRTDQNGTMRLAFLDDGSWVLNSQQ